MPKKARLILTTGQEFIGESFGYEGPSDGEVVFSTGMVGFELSLTDPSYRGQILCFTFPLVGNVGVPPFDKDEHGIIKNFESENIHVRGLVCSTPAKDFSHFRGEKTLTDWLKENKVPAIAGIDTRELTQVLREHGTCLGQIVIEDGEPKKTIENPEEGNLVAEVSIDKVQVYKPKNSIKKRVLVVDTGIKRNILRSFLKRGVEIIHVPWNFDASTGEYEFDGLFIANGPGDPKKVAPVIAKNIKWAYEKGVPCFGICLGNQILALSLGGNTYKLPYGHRSVNQPVQDIETEKCYVTSQNHGFAVDEKKIPKDFKIWFKNLNDGSVEGIKHKTKPIFSVQFHPEACPGPQDAQFLFDEFIKLL